MMIFNFRTIITQQMIITQLNFHHLLKKVQVYHHKQKSKSKLLHLQKIKIRQNYHHFLNHYHKLNQQIKQANNCLLLPDQNFKLSLKLKTICKLHHSSWLDFMDSQSRLSMTMNQMKNMQHQQINECYVGTIKYISYLSRFKLNI